MGFGKILYTFAETKEMLLWSQSPKQYRILSQSLWKGNIFSDLDKQINEIIIMIYENIAPM